MWYIKSLLSNVQTCADMHLCTSKQTLICKVEMHLTTNFQRMCRAVRTWGMHLPSLFTPQWYLSVHHSDMYYSKQTKDNTRLQTPLDHKATMFTFQACTSLLTKGKHLNNSCLEDEHHCINEPSRKCTSLHIPQENTLL